MTERANAPRREDRDEQPRPAQGAQWLVVGARRRLAVAAAASALLWLGFFWATA